MSMNWKEIDCVLSELDLEGARIERVIQPSYDSIVLGLYKSGVSVELLISIAQGACRIHSLPAAAPKPARPLRFMECLRSRLRGGRIDYLRQLGSQRVLRCDISVPRADQEQGPRFLSYRLYARLWSGAGNIVLVDQDGIVVDALARRPARGELSGQPCRIEQGLKDEAAMNSDSGHGSKPGREFSLRELPGDGSFDQRLAAWYSDHGGELSRERLLAAARARFQKRSAALQARIAALDARAAEFRDAERIKELGDILMANQNATAEGKRLVCADFYRGGDISIPVDPGRSILDNARRYYEKYRKARSGGAELDMELVSLRHNLELEHKKLESIEAQEEPLLMARALAKGGTVSESQRRPYPGLWLDNGGWTMLIGRSAKENDELLRRHVKGSDLWLHARDWPGAYVFIKARRGKSVPLEILLDAAMLALYYSKGRDNGCGDLYYTFVKYLRRAKDGPKGLVIPMQEKNLSVRIDEGRLRELRGRMSDEAGDSP